MKPSQRGDFHGALGNKQYTCVGTDVECERTGDSIGSAVKNLPVPGKSSMSAQGCSGAPSNMFPLDLCFLGNSILQDDMFLLIYLYDVTTRQETLEHWKGAFVIVLSVPFLAPDTEQAFRISFK